jgi:hypothetical protein
MQGLVMLLWGRHPDSALHSDPRSLTARPFTNQIAPDGGFRKLGGPSTGYDADPAGTQFLDPGVFPFQPDSRMQLATSIKQEQGISTS